MVLAVSATRSLANPAERLVAVSFVFPDGVTKSTQLTDGEVRNLVHENFGYMIEWWVRGAIAKLKLSTEISVVDPQSKAKAVTSVDGVANGPNGRWVLYVDGVRSRYHINTKLRQHERSIRLVYEQVGKLAG